MNPELVSQIFQLIIIPLLGALTVYVVKFINIKSDELKSKTHNTNLNKYLDLLNDTITTCVIATNQTYVDALKKAGTFDKEAQKEAFRKTYDAVMEILSEDALKYITEAVGDVQKYLTESIEATIKVEKTC